MEEIQSRIKSTIGIIELNRSDKLNSLNLEMIRSMTKQLDLFAQNEDIHAVFLSGRGKGFCAGGDVVSLVKSAPITDAPIPFFQEEYALDLKIARFPKPIVAWSHGATMGGGWGLFQGAAQRVVSSSSKLCMPEITIGLFPDVGASYFLNRLPSVWGLVLGLTGMRLNAGLALMLGVADYLIDEERWASVQADIFHHPEELKMILGQAKQPIPLQDQELFEALSEAIAPLAPWPGLTFFDEWARSYRGLPLLEQALQTYQKGSPTSAAVIERQLLHGQELTLEEAFVMEERMANHFLRHHDFYEGVRALLIDKDYNPQWNPKDLSSIDHNIISAHF